MRWPKFPIVEVVWADAYASEEWHTPEDTEPLYVYSVGVPVLDNDKVLTLALNNVIDGDDKEPNSCVIHIPKKMISKIRYIRRGNEKKS